MQQFIKKFSFVLAAAMVLTSVAVPASAEAATKGEVTVKGSAVSSKTVWAGGKSVNFDYKYGKKTSGIKGVWTSNNANIVVNPTSGKVTATGKADGTVTFTPDSKKYKKITVAVKARVRATGLFVREDDKNGQVVSEASVKVGETKKFYVSMSTKLHVKSTYFTHVSASTTAASVTNGANGTSYAGANYGRELTVTGLATGTSVINVSATPYTDDRTSNYDPTPVTLTVKVGEEKIDNKFESGAKQIGAKKIEAVLDTTTMTATNPGVFLVRDDAPNTIIRFEKVTIGNNNVVFDLDTPLLNNVKYSLKNGKGETVASFVATGELVANVVINDGLKISTVDKKTAVGSFEVKNQWGEAYTGAGVNGRLAYYFTNDQGQNVATVGAKDYATDRSVDGRVYFTTTTTTADGKNEFKVGDVKKINLVVTGTQFSQTVSKYLIVDGTAEVSSYTIFDDNINYKGVKVVDAELAKLDKDEINNYSFDFYVAYPAGVDVQTKGKNFVAYLVNGTSKTDVTKAVVTSYADKLAINNKNSDTANELVGSIAFNKLTLKKNTSYYIEVSYVGETGVKTLNSKTFALDDDYAPASNVKTVNDVNAATTLKAPTKTTKVSTTLNVAFAGMAANTAVVVTSLNEDGKAQIDSISCDGFSTKKNSDGSVIVTKAANGSAYKVTINAAGTTLTAAQTSWAVNDTAGALLTDASSAGTVNAGSRTKYTVMNAKSTPLGFITIENKQTGTSEYKTTYSATQLDGTAVAFTGNTVVFGNKTYTITGIDSATVTVTPAWTIAVADGTAGDAKFKLGDTDVTATFGDTTDEKKINDIDAAGWTLTTPDDTNHKYQFTETSTGRIIELVSNTAASVIDSVTDKN